MKLIQFALLLLPLTLVGCQIASPTEQVSLDTSIPTQFNSHTTIEAFVETAQLPSAQPTKIIYTVPAQALTFFTVSYGEPQDCLAGCFYSQGYGLQYQERIGWMSFDHFDQAVSDEVIAALTRFDIRSSDTGLYDATILAGLEQAGDRNFLNVYKQFLAEHPLTP